MFYCKVGLLAWCIVLVAWCVVLVAWCVVLVSCARAGLGSKEVSCVLAWHVCGLADTVWSEVLKSRM